MGFGGISIAKVGQTTFAKRVAGSGANVAAAQLAEKSGLFASR
jgi:hypothetical protein